MLLLRSVLLTLLRQAANGLILSFTAQVQSPRPRNSRDSSSLAPRGKTTAAAFGVALLAGTVNERLAELTTFRRIRHPSATKKQDSAIEKRNLQLQFRVVGDRKLLMLNDCQCR